MQKTLKITEMVMIVMTVGIAEKKVPLAMSIFLKCEISKCAIYISL